MITLTFSVDQQELQRTDSEKIVSNSSQLYQCVFDFPEEWQDTEKVAIFTKDRITRTVLLDENDSCFIPGDILKSTKDVFLTVGVTGVSDRVITSTLVNIPVVSGSSTSGASVEIGRTLFEQIMKKIDEVKKGEVEPELVEEVVNEWIAEHPFEPIIAEDVADYFVAHHDEFKGDKGDKGDRGLTGLTPEITATAEVDASVGTPSVTVQRTGTDENPNLHFNFQNMKGVKGDKGDTGATPNVTATAEVGATVGTPSVSVTKTGTAENPALHFNFQNLKGVKGDKGDKGNTGSKGDTGATGNGIASIEKTATSGLVDTYTITYTDGSTSTFEVRNGDGSYDDTEVKAEIADANADIQKISDTFGTMAYEPLDLTLTLGKYARKDNGVLVNDSSMVMGYVELTVEPEQIYYITTNLSGNCAIVFYNNGVYVSDLNSLGAISDYQVTIPENVNLMRVSNRYASTTGTIVKGYTISYAPFKNQVDDALYDIETLQIQVNTLNDVIEHVKYPVYTDKTGELTTDYIINYQTGNQTSASGAANTIIDVTPRETYRINCDLSGNTGIVGFDSNNVVTFGFNNVTGVDYAISTGVYEVTIPNGTVKLGVSTRHQSSAPIGIYLKTYEFYDFADITETVDNLNFDAKVLAERAYDIETRLRFSWKTFDKGKVVFMTDDTLSDIGVITSLLMNTYSFPMSYACITNTLENAVDANDNNYAKVKDVLLASQAYGGEVFSHSINSDDWGDNPATNGGYNGYIPDSESDRRLRDSKYALSQYGLEANGFISPRGSDLRNYGYGVAKYYRYAYYQGTDIPQIFHFTRTNIKSLTLENLKTSIDNCANNHSLLVLMCHKVVDTNGEGYGVYPNGFTMADFTAIMDYLKWGTDETKTTPRTDLEVTSLKKVYAEYASIG